MWIGNEATEMRDIQFQAGRLPDRAVIGVEGPDSAHFLHNLLTADIEQLAPGEARYAALLTPQGKILFDMLVLRHGRGLPHRLRRQPGAALVQRLGMYKLRAKVRSRRATTLPSASLRPSDSGRLTATRARAAIGWRIIGPPPDGDGRGL